MKTFMWIAVTFGALTFAGGCTEQTTKKTTTTTTSQNGNGASAVKDAAKSAGDTASKTAGDAAKTAGDAASTAGDAAKGAVEGLGQEFSSAATSAQDALKGVEGGPDIYNQVTEVFTGAKDSLQGVTNSETAQNAATKLDELGGKIDGLTEKIKSLPQGARTSLVGMIEKGIAQLKPLADKAMGLPGVENILKPKFDAFVAKLEELKQ
jgi:hypothetical protein